MMKIKKRGFRREEGSFFKKKLVLDSNKSKIAFIFIVFLFGVVIVFGVIDAYDGLIRVNNLEGENVEMSPEDDLVCIKCPDLNYDGIVTQKDGDMMVDCVYHGNQTACRPEFDLNGDGIYTIVGDIPCWSNYNNIPTWKIESCLSPTRHVNLIKPAIILIDFGNYSHPINLDRNYWSNSVFDAEYPSSLYNWFGEISYGQFIISGDINDVYGWYTLPIPELSESGLCRWWDLFDDIINITDSDINFSGYDIILVNGQFPCSGSGYWGRNATTQEGEIPIAVPGFQYSFSKHELGHMFGDFGEGSALECENLTIGGEECRTIKYGDTFDVMGTSIKNAPLNAVYKKKFGWISDMDIVNVNTSGIYEINPIELPIGRKLIEIPTSQNFAYYLEFRRSVGVDSPFPGNPSYSYPEDVFDGAMIHKAPGFDNYAWVFPTSYLLDMSPANNPSFDWYDVVLKEGKTFKDPYDNITITTLEVTNQSLKVSVTFPSKCGNSLLETGEQCDDGNTISRDGCSSTCQTETQQCSSGADRDGNNIVDNNEVNIYIQRYYLGNVNINNVSNAINEHLNGCV